MCQSQEHSQKNEAHDEELEHILRDTDVKWAFTLCIDNLSSIVALHCQVVAFAFLTIFEFTRHKGSYLSILNQNARQMNDTALSNMPFITIAKVLKDEFRHIECLLLLRPTWQSEAA